MKEYTIKCVEKINIISSYIENRVAYQNKYVIDTMNKVTLYEENNDLYLKIDIEICNKNILNYFINQFKFIINKSIEKDLDQLIIFYKIVTTNGEELINSIRFRGCEFAKKEILSINLTEVNNFDIIYRILDPDIALND